MNRRSFLGTLASIFGFFAISSIGTNASADRKRGGGDSAASTSGGAAAGKDDVKLVDPNSSQAKAVNYAEKKSDVKNASVKTERQGVKFDDQKCASCSFYSNPRQYKGAEVGNCQIFPGMQVKADAWCSSWNKKA